MYFIGNDLNCPVEVQSRYQYIPGVQLETHIVNELLVNEFKPTLQNMSQSQYKVVIGTDNIRQGTWCQYNAPVMHEMLCSANTMMG